MATVFRSGVPRHDRPDQPPPETSEELLGRACTLLRLCGQDAAIAAVLLVLVAAGVVTRLAYGGRPEPVALLPLPALAASFATSAGLAVRSRRTLVTALGSVRAATGAPLEPGVPWTPAGLATALDPRVRDGELRLLLGAAHRCCDLAWRAVVWGVLTGVLFVLWTAVAAAAGAGG
ncbi:hypothetical protein GCM10010191_83120 [Actinomadura vinacea]|uniref:Integral membrane plasmid transfer protein n=1 Tax=Actinomadura vinacea TaxID=115336 RepID=A0ABN3K8K9_9ACTN